MGISHLDPDARGRRPWNAGSLVGAKRPLKPACLDRAQKRID